MHPILIAFAVLVPVALILIYLIARELRLTNAIAPDESASADNSDFESEVEALIESRKTKN